MPYAAGELLARVRERGTVELEYRETDVRVRGRVAPSLAGELESAAGRWASQPRRDDRRGRADGPMTALVRRAGTATLPDGAEVRWTVADGRRGRRWRVATTLSGALVASVLLEVDQVGRPSRLELATAAGLLTLHPEPSGGLHGNVVLLDGVRHLAMAWGADHELGVDGLPIADAVTARRLAATTGVGEGRLVRVVTVGLDLSVREGVARYTRVADGTWQIDDEDGAAPRTVTIDARGLPAWPERAAEWPLELDPAP